MQVDLSHLEKGYLLSPSAFGTSPKSDIEALSESTKHKLVGFGGGRRGWWERSELW
jgi:hypothetical protein